MSDHTPARENLRATRPPHFWHGLLWKELRQLRPLVVMLVCLTAVLAIAYQLLGEHVVHAIPAQAIPLMMPVLFAAGAGAILVSNEKETKSLRWFATLPIDPRKVYFGKLAAAMLGLLGTWIACGLLWLAMGTMWGRQPPLSHYLFASIHLSTPSWMLYTVFILVCGLYTAWRWEGAFTSLVLMLVMAAVPFMIADTAAKTWSAQTREFVPPETVSTIAGGVTLPSIVLLAWLGLRATTRYLQPKETKLERRSVAGGLAWEAKQSQPIARPCRFPISSLLWQSIHHDRRVLAGLAIAIGLGTLCFPILWIDPPFILPRSAVAFLVLAGLIAVSWLGVFALTSDSSILRLRFLADRDISPRLIWLGRYLAGLAITIGLASLYFPLSWIAPRYIWLSPPVVTFFVLTGLVAVSWLGVFAFTGDGSVARLRFLSDRGISPRLVWLGRHLIAVAGLSSVLLFLAGLQVWGVGLSASSGYYSRAIPVFSLATLAMLLAIIYGISQWTSQVIRLLAGTAFLAPVLSACMVGWMVMAGTTMGSSPWLILFCITIPFGVTAVMMGRHMEGRRDAIFWGVHGLAAAACVLLPIANMAWDISRFPSMSRARFQEVRAMAASVRRSSPQGNHVLPTDDAKAWKAIRLKLENDDEIIRRIAARGEGPAAWMALSGPADSPLAGDYRLLLNAIGSTEYYRLNLIAEPTDEHKERFAQWSNTLVEIARRLRLSDRFTDQEAADKIEIYLTQTYAKSEMAVWSDQGFTKQAIELIADRQGRRDARRRAVLVSWSRFVQARENEKPIGRDGLQDYLWLFNVPDLQHHWIYPRGVNAMTDQLLRMIDADEAGESTDPIRRKLHALFFGNQEFYEIGPYAERMQPSTSPTAPTSHDLLWNFPALAWFAPWESEAEKLAVVDLVKDPISTGSFTRSITR